MHGRMTQALRLCLLLIGLVVGCTVGTPNPASTCGSSVAVGPSSPTPGQRERPAVEQRDRGLFYQVSQGASAVYLLGSIHVGRSDLYPMRPEIERAFEEADTAVVELTLDEASTQNMKLEVLQAMMYPAGESLEAHLSIETRAALMEFLRQTGLPAEGVARLRPWAAAVLVTTLGLEKAEYSADDGMDVYFQRRAAESGKPVVALETAKEQLELFTTIEEPIQELMLREALEGHDTLSQTMAEALAAWKRGDADGLSRALLDPMRTSEYQTLFEKVFSRRNQRMAEAVQRLLSTGGKHFVVVGSGHLIGEGGVVDLLRRAGRSVEQR